MYFADRGAYRRIFCVYATAGGTPVGSVKVLQSKVVQIRVHNN